MAPGVVLEGLGPAPASLSSAPRRKQLLTRTGPRKVLGQGWSQEGIQVLQAPIPSSLKTFITILMMCLYSPRQGQQPIALLNMH